MTSLSTGNELPSLTCALNPRRAVELRTITRDGLQLLPARRVFKTELSIFDVGLTRGREALMLTSITIAGAQRADVRYGLFDDDLETIGGKTYVNHRATLHASESDDDWTLE